MVWCAVCLDVCRLSDAFLDALQGITEHFIKYWYNCTKHLKTRHFRRYKHVLRVSKVIHFESIEKHTVQIAQKKHHFLVYIAIL